MQVRPRRQDTAPPAPCRFGFVLFILVNAVLFIRPAEIVPALLELPIYEVLILSCLAFSLPAVLGRLRPGSLASQPVSVCVLGLLGAVVLSHLSHLEFGLALASGREFLKLVVYYLLLVGLVTTFTRLRCFLFWLGLFVMVLVALALLQWRGLISIKSLEAIQQRQTDAETGQVTSFARLCSTGIYHDPNDLCLILLVGAAIFLYFLGDRSAGPLRFLWLLPLLVIGYALALTRSRGGFLGLLGEGLVLFTARFGLKKTIPLALVFLPAMAILFGGRQTKIDLSNQDDTAQSRILLWRDGFDLLKEAPLFGIGAGAYEDRVTLVAHNSFVHSYTELGFFGGTCFAGAFFLAAGSLRRSRAPAVSRHAEVDRLRPYLLAAVMSYIVSMLSLSRTFIAPTYMIPALAVVYTGLPETAGRLRSPRFDGSLLVRLVLIGLVTLVTFHAFVRVFAHSG